MSTCFALQSDNTHLRTFSTAEQLYLFLSKLIQTQDDLIKLATGLRLTKEQVSRLRVRMRVFSGKVRAVSLFWSVGVADARQVSFKCE